MKEEWREILGYEGLYEVSNTGFVRKVNSGHILKDRDNGRGYRYVRLHNGSIYTVYVHRLVAKAFLPNPLGLPQVNHKNEVKDDNRVENLEWCTAKYNVNYGMALEKNRIHNSIKIAQYDLDGNWIKDWDSGKAAVIGLGGNSLSTINNCLKGRSKTALGYIWRYKDVQDC